MTNLRNFIEIDLHNSAKNADAPDGREIALRAATDADWWRGAAIYQVYPRSFRDSNGDGVGDIAGLISRLEHIAALGVDAIWLSPIFLSPMKDFGYDVADHCVVDPVFGTLDDFDRLVARNHALGMKLIIDQVYSHTSDEHRWFAESRAGRGSEKADWYVWADARPDGGPPNNWQSVFGGPAWTYDSRRRQYYLHNFLPAQPDLNVRHPAVQDALLDVARFWLDRGVDGFRLDAINFAMHCPTLTDNPPRGIMAEPPPRTFDFQEPRFNRSQPDTVTFLERLRALLDERGASFSVAEIGGNEPESDMHLYTRGTSRLHTAYSFRFLTAETLDADAVREILAAWPGEPGEGWPSWALSNHDAPRHVSRWAATPLQTGAVARATMLMLVALRGTIFLYQGEELGLPQAQVPRERMRDPEAIANWPDSLGRDGARTPMPWQSGAPHAGFSTVEPWLPLDPAHDALAVDRQAGDPGSMLQFTRRLLALRRGSGALRWGDLTIVDSAPALLAFERQHQGEKLLFIANLGEAPVAHTLEERWEVIAASGDDRSPPFPLPPHLAPWDAYLARPVSDRGR